eukprot:Phypoly_transcript_15497.p1 GENE.Phypoly_transcript_15497~~Phypoly_transcript_15497.p1  ORF type:complete len:196 (+),score=33.14 Phypoly_transcript_15497:131-718(+)
MIDKKTNLVAAYEQIQEYKEALQEVQELRNELKTCMEEQKQKDKYYARLVELVVSTPDPLVWVPYTAGDKNVQKYTSFKQSMPKPPTQSLRSVSSVSTSVFGFLKTKLEIIPFPKFDEVPALPVLYMDSHIWTTVFFHVDVFTFASVKRVCKVFYAASRNPVLRSIMDENANVYVFQRRVCKIDFANNWLVCPVH